MLSVGDRATGVPASPIVRRKYPTVTGIYDKNQVDTGLTKFTVEYVQIGNGEFVDCSSVRPASRRDKETQKVVA
jgi:hypothetical protein